jgi:hypothetical protein
MNNKNIKQQGNITLSKLKELVESFSDLDLSNDDNATLYDQWNDFLNGSFLNGSKDKLEVDGWTIIAIEQDRLNSDVYVVFQIGDELWRMDGWYDSYEGSNFDDAVPYKVITKEVTVIEYVKAPR